MILFFAASLPAIIQTSSTAEAHVLSSAQERGIGIKVFKRNTKKHEIVTPSDDHIVSVVQKRLVECNPKKLNMKDGRHKRWLAPTVIDNTPNYPNAYMYPGGYSVIYSKEIEYDTTYDEAAAIQNDRRRPTTPAYYTSNSNIAAILAHEYGHWSNADFLRNADRHLAISALISAIPIPVGAVAGATIAVQGGNVMLNREESFKSEQGADQSSLEFLSNVPEYSMGSALSSFARYKKYLRSYHLNEGGGFENFVAAHSHTDTRMQRACDYIKKISHNRVDIDIDCRLRVDGAYLCGTGYLADAYRADGKERTAFLAGQMATCIQKGIWKRGYLACLPENQYSPSDGSADRTILVVCSAHGRNGGCGSIEKVLGTFDYPLGKKRQNLTASERMAADELRAVWNLADE